MNFLTFLKARKECFHVPSWAQSESEATLLISLEALEDLYNEWEAIQ